LLADGEIEDTVELSDTNDWVHTFTELPTVHDVTDEKAIAYTVEEVEIEGYEVSINGNAEEGFIVTNTFIEEGQKEESKEDPKENPSGPTGKDDFYNKPTIQPEDSSDNNGDKLPKTATNTFNALMIGLTLMLLGAFPFLFRRKESQ